MKVILLQNVEKLGQKFDIRDVSSGYAANFLLPRGLAETATDAKLRSLESALKNHEEEKRIQEELLCKNIDSLKGAKITIEAKANEKGHLFKSVHAEDIVKALKEQASVDINPGMLILKQPIKAVGSVKVAVKAGDHDGVVLVEISALG